MRIVGFVQNGYCYFFPRNFAGREMKIRKFSEKLRTFIVLPCFQGSLKLSALVWCADYITHLLRKHLSTLNISFLFKFRAQHFIGYNIWW